MDAGNEGVDNEFSTPNLKVYCLHNPPTINYNYGRSNCFSMVWNNLIVFYHALSNVVKACVNVVSAIATFADPTPPTNIIKN